MGIIADGGAIIIGGLLGHLFHKRHMSINMNVLGISIMLIGALGTFSNMLCISEGLLESKNLIVIVLCLLAGNMLGERIDLEGKAETIGGIHNGMVNAAMIGTIFFGVGGLQISGSIACMIKNDNSILLLKCAVDFPLALAFGAAYGIGIALSGFPVMMIQIAVGLCACFARAFFSDDTISQLCAIGYILLFCSGFNLLFDNRHRVQTMNLLPSILILIVYNAVIQIMGVRV